MMASGNLPAFAQGNSLAFWLAADTHERVNGRVYTELQTALPNELTQQQREELARAFTRSLLADRFAYTLAVHTSERKDGSTQSDMHLMFSERAITERAAKVDRERFFRRNGAPKDRGWNTRSKPQEVRVLWVNCLNAALAEAGLTTRVDARSWAEQGRHDLAALREPKLLTGKGPVVPEAQTKVEELRRLRQKLPAMHLHQKEALQTIIDQGEQAIREVEHRRDLQLAAIEQQLKTAGIHPV